ncbi:MAG: hypothetical protein KBD37_00875 [Burkholderiales bacterium]|nr:hypothetical protein [Burkholderiales bacterium]
MTKLQIFIAKTPVYSKSSIILRVGFFADDYSLTEVTTMCSFTINFGNENITQINNNQFFANIAGDVGIQALYSPPTNNLIQQENPPEYIATTSFVIMGEATLPNKDDIYACIKREEPEGVYTQVADVESFTYLDNQAVADIFANLYKNLQIEANQVYPESTTDCVDWIYMLFSEVYINTEQGQINQVLQLLRNLQILASMNPFDVAAAITSYIYYRTNLAIYVFIQEDKVNLDKAWILGTDKSILGVNTYLQQNHTNSNLIINVFDVEHQLEDTFKIELESFISKITRAYFGYMIEYAKTPAQFNLNYDIGMTYKGDQRIIYSYCLKYSEAAFYKVIGLINPIQPSYIQDMLITPENGSIINTPIKLTVIGVFVDGVTAEITLMCQIIKSNNNLKIIGDVLVPNKNGECTLTISYGSITQAVTYVSEMATQTIIVSSGEC